MSTIFDNLHLARHALLAHQAALNTIGHNLANVATPGYSRQRAELVPLEPRNGVKVETIRRIRDRLLDFQALNERGVLGRAEGRDSVLGRLETIFNEPVGIGLGSALDELFKGFQDLSVNPENLALREAVKAQGAGVATAFQRLRGRLDQLKNDLTTEIRGKVGDANALLTQLADLQGKIQQAAKEPPPNDLLDRRDQLVDRLSQIVGVAATDLPDGTVQLALAGSGVLLLDGTLTAPLTTAVNLAGDTVDLTVGTVAVTPRSGALAALVEVRNAASGPLKQAITDLNSLARSLVAEVNRLHASGTGLTEHTSLTSVYSVSASGAPLTAAGLPYTPATGSFSVIVHDSAGAVTANVGIPVTAGVTTLDDVRAAIGAIPGLMATISAGRLTVTAAAGRTFTFAADTSDTLGALGLNTFFTGSSALDIALNPVVANDVSKIAAARADAAGLVHSGDGSNALGLARLRTALAMSGGTESFGGFYGGLVSRAGFARQDAKQTLDRQQATVRVVENLQQQVAGVSTDEELISLTQSQTAYAAAARYASTINEVLEALLRMV